MEGAGGFRPFGANGGAGSSGGGVSSFWDVKEPAADPLVLDAWRHRQVDAGRGSPPPPAGQAQRLGTLDATLNSLREDQRLQGFGPHGGGMAPTYGQHPVYGKAMHSFGAPPHGHGVSTTSTAVSLGDLHLSQGTGFSSLSLDVSAHAALHPQKSIAELSDRRRDAIKAAFRRIDVKGQGWVSIQELAMGMQRFSNLVPMEQERVAHAMSPPGARLGVDWGGQVSFATFAGYYQLLGSSIERDRDFEDLMRHHWGFAEVSDILDDMKNKFAMVGLAYAFRRCLDHGGSPEMSMEAFQDSISQVGMHYSGNDLRRLFDAFDGRGQSTDSRTLEVLRLTQHLTSAPRPSTPIAQLFGTAHFSEVHSQAELSDAAHPSSAGGFAASHGMGLPGLGVGHTMSHGMGQSAHGAFAGHGPATRDLQLGVAPFNSRLRPGELPPTVPAPEEGEVSELHLPPPQAPPEEDDCNDALGSLAPPEREADGKNPVEQPTEAPPEDEDGGEIAPFEHQPDNPQEAPYAPRELDLGPAMGHSQHSHHYHHHHHQQHGHAAVPHHSGFSPQHLAASHRHQTPAVSPQHQHFAASPQHAAATPAHSSASPSGGRRRAVTIGINYIGLQCKLSGCINDSDTFISLLTEEFGYSVADIRQLRDDHPQRMPTRKNITAALHWLVNGARAGDHLFLHYSGHGSQQKDTDGDELDGRDETLVPCDYQHHGMLSDDELRRILVQKLPKGCRLTCIMDCCHSGTVLDLAYKVVIQDGGLVDIKKKPAHKLLPTAEGDVVMISGCMDKQTSADAGIGLAGNTSAAGAMTTAFKLVATKYASGSYHRFICEMRKFLKANKFAQVPQLSSDHAICLTDCFMPEAEGVEPPPPAPMRPPVRKALTIGINYLTLWPGRGRLSGCINDSETMVGILKDTFGFEDAQICRLRDDRANMMPTKANILASFRWLTQGAAPGDELFLHYSGHGGQKADKSGDEESGKDDTLIPCDFQTAGQIIDDELHEHLVQHLPKGCRMWVILDCCHSGTALDLPFKVQLSEDGTSAQMSKSKSSKTGPAPSQAEVIMISGCKDCQTSADASAGSMGATKAAGAMTTAFRHCINPTISCEDLLKNMRHFLKRNQYKQVPQMSSERFVQLDASFVQYEGKQRHKRKPAAATRDLPMDLSPTDAYPPRSPNLPAHTGHFATAQDFYNASAYPGAHPQSPMGGMPMTPTHQVHPDADKYAMDSRINKLEGQIAELRAQQHSPINGGFPPTGDLHGSVYGARAPGSPMHPGPVPAHLSGGSIAPHSPQVSYSSPHPYYS